MIKETAFFDIINSSIQKALSNTHTCLIARVEKVNQKTIDCQPVLRRKKNETESIKLPLFKDVPIINLQGGSSNILLPIASGDYVLLMISERCYDYWYTYGYDDSLPPVNRMHDYSDSFALYGVNTASTSHDIPTQTTINGDLIINGNVTINGDLTVTGTIIADDCQTSSGVSLKNHTHGGVQSGSSNTTSPN